MEREVMIIFGIKWRWKNPFTIERA